MKYLFNALAWVFIGGLTFCLWAVMQFFIFLWHFNFKHCKPYRDFNLEIDVEGGMLRWTIIFMVLAIIAGIFGWGQIAGEAAGLAKILFYIFLTLFILSLIASSPSDDMQNV